MNYPNNFRRATLADVPTILAVTREAYRKWIPIIGREPAPMKTDFTEAIKEHIIDLFLDGKNVVGLIELIQNKEHLLIENIAVRTASQDQGIGDNLLKHAEAVARHLKLGELRLYTNSAFAQNIKYYIKRGYEEFERGAIPTGGVVVHMKKITKS